MDARQPLVLASSSPRRRVLLAMLNVEVEVIAARIDEAAVADGLEPLEAVAAVARAKLASVQGEGRPVLAADTIVVHETRILGKPTDRGAAEAMLRRQSGSVVQVITCVALRHVGGEVDDRIAISTLKVDRLDDETIAQYLATGEADDKAGALAVQGAAKEFTTVITGSKSNVYGLPLGETIALLRRAGIDANP